MRKFLWLAVMMLSSLQAFAAEGDTISLNEKWLFLLSKDAASVPRNVQTARFNDSKWGLLRVPAQWSVRASMRSGNYVGTYRGWIKVPETFKGRTVILHIGNCTSTASVWVNGTLVGKTDAAVATKEFDITRLLKPGRNLYVIQMPRWDAADTVHDKILKSGITSDCYLYGLPDSIQQAVPPIPARVSGGKINGIRARIADRNDIEPATGFIDSFGRMQEDIRLLRQLNFNAVTYNKASSDPLFGELCAQNGLLIVADSANSVNKGAKIVDEKRNLTAEGIAVVHANQYITTSGNNLNEGKITVQNGYPDQNLDNVEMIWQLLADGLPVKQGLVTDLKAAPRQSVQITLPYTTEGIDKNKEVFLKTMYRYKGATELIASDLISVRDFSYSDAVRAGREASMYGVAKPKPRLNNKEKDALTIWDTNYSLQIDKNTGLIQTYVLNGVQVITNGGAVMPNEKTRLLNLSVGKPNKVNGTKVTAQFGTEKGNLTWTYNISVSGVLTIEEPHATDIYLIFADKLSQINYYARDEFGEMNATSLDELRGNIRWWKQTDASGRGVQLIGNGEFYALPTAKGGQLLLHPGVQPFKLTFLPATKG